MHETRTRRGLAAATLMLALAAVLGGCASGPKAPGGITLPLPGRDGPEANPPTELARVPDAEPRIEPIRDGGPNKPYQVLGRSYVPMTQDLPFTERGLASWYGRKFQGRRTANGEVYDMYAMTAAHPTLPLPSYARVRNPANGREVVVRVNDRGPFHPGRIVDLSYTAALKLGVLRNVAPVELTRITFDDIRTGAWRRDDGANAVRMAARTDDGGAGASAVSDAGTLRAAPGGAAPEAATQRAASASAAAAAAAAETDATANPRVESAAAATGPGDSQSATALPAAGTGVPDASNAAQDTSVVSASNMSSPAPASAVATPPSAGPPSPPVTLAAASATAARATSSEAPSYWVQLGAFRQRAGATGFRQRVAAELDWLAPVLEVFGEASLFRLQAGPYPSRDAASSVAERVRAALQLVPAVVERR